MSEWYKLSEVARTNPEALSATTDPDYEFGYIDLGSASRGGIDWDSVRHMRFGGSPSRARRALKPGDVLFGTVRPNLQSHGYVHESAYSPLVASTGFTVLRPVEGVSIGRYLRYAALSDYILRQSKQLSVGSNYPAITENDVSGFWVFCPHVLEQKIIANILESLDAQVQQTQSLIAKLEKVKEGLLTDLLTRGLDENGELRPPPDEAPHLYKNSSVGRIPKRWEVKELGGIADIVSGVTLGGNDAGPAGEMVPYLRVANVQDGYLDLSDVKQIRVSPQLAMKFRLEFGDVLMNEGGDNDKLGRGAIWKDEVPGCVHQNHVFRVRVKRSEIFPEYLAYYSSSAIGKSFFLRSSKQSTNLASINSKQLHGFPIACPSVEEQALQVSRLEAVSQRIEMESAVLGKLLKERAGLKNDLLTGHVRVKSLLEGYQQRAAG